MPVRRKAVSLGGSKRYPPLAPGAEDGTPERLAHGARTGGVGVEAGVRRLADPFDLLRKRQALDGRQPAANDQLWEIGDRYRRHWYRSRLDNLTAFDVSQGFVDGTSGLGATPTETAMRHRETLRKAAAAVGPRLLPILDGIVRDGRSAEALAPLVRDTGHARTATALVIERLREALYRLGEHWGMTGPAGGG